MLKSFHFIFILFACQSTPQQQIETISASQLKALQKEGITIIDIRTPSEYLDGHIPNVPNIDFRNAQFIEQISMIEKDQPIIIHCASGGRSKTAANQLIKIGFSKVYDYEGGFYDWKERGELIEK
ncbi:Rhodanese-like domain-containing protein [Ochromonadaceae sp. CCMP2298]|nr:Rhodanese-like domain-containing protein [Ochromonadaceae sp. CCMP2298]